MSQEEVYDEKIFPLMAQIIDICKEYKMPFIASFACPNDEDPDLRATSYLNGPEYIGDKSGFPEALSDIRYGRQRSGLVALTVTTDLKKG